MRAWCVLILFAFTACECNQPPSVAAPVGTPFAPDAGGQGLTGDCTCPPGVSITGCIATCMNGKKP